MMHRADNMKMIRMIMCRARNQASLEFDAEAFRRQLSMADDDSTFTKALWHHCQN